MTRLWSLRRAARLYLLHAGLLTFGLAFSVLFFNFAIPALGYNLRFLGLLNSLPTLIAGLCSLPLWWLVTRVIALRTALILSAVLQATALLTVAIWPAYIPLLLGLALTGPAAVLFQISAAPFMMRHSSDTERDFLFSMNAGLNIGIGGLGALVGGTLPGLFARLLDVSSQSAMAYRATFALAGLIVLAAIAPLLLIQPDQRQRPTNEPLSLDHTPVDSVDPRRSIRDVLRPVSMRRRLSMLLTHIPEPWRSMLRHPWSVVRFMVTPLLISCGAALLIPFLNLYFRQRFGVSNEALGAIFAAISIATGLATLTAPWLSLRFGKMSSVVITQSLAVPCLLALGATPFLGVAIGLAMLRNTLMNMAAPLYDAYAMEQSSEAARPTVIGLINGAFSIGYIFGPNISVRVQDSIGFAPLFYATAAIYTLAAGLNYVLFVRKGNRVMG